MDKGDLKKALQESRDRDVAEAGERINKLELLKRLTAVDDEDIEAYMQMSDAEVAAELREMGVDAEAAWERIQRRVAQAMGNKESVTKDGPDPLV